MKLPSVIIPPSEKGKVLDELEKVENEEEEVKQD